MASFWTPERDDDLRLLVGQQLSYAAIAVQLGHSRNAVIGRAQRLKLSNPMTSEKPRGGQPRNPYRKRYQPRGGPVKNYAADPGLVDRPAPIVEPPVCIEMNELTHAVCHWPLWNDEQPARLYCGLPAEDLRSYCPGHQALAYQRR
jgi:GcrA cell cycle regulator